MKTVLFLEGDSVQREKAIIKICKEVYPDQEVERKIYKADQGQIPNAVEELFSYSLFDDTKIIIVTQIDKLLSRKRKSQDDAEEDDDESNTTSSAAELLQPLFEAVSHPRGDTPLLMFSEAKTNIPKKFLDLLGKDRIVTLTKTPAADIRKSVEKKCQNAEITLSKPAMDFFMELCGKSVESAQQEIEKIVLWAEKGQEVDLDTCRRLIWGETESNIWDIANGIQERNPVKALQALQKLFAEGEEGYSILGTLISTFRNLHVCKSMLDEKIPEKEWKNYLNVAPFILDRCKSTSKKYTLSSLQHALTLLCEADSGIKGGKSEPRLVVERLVLDLCRI